LPCTLPHAPHANQHRKDRERNPDNRTSFYRFYPPFYTACLFPTFFAILAQLHLVDMLFSYFFICVFHLTPKTPLSGSLCVEKRDRRKLLYDLFSHIGKNASDFVFVDNVEDLPTLFAAFQKPKSC